MRRYPRLTALAVFLVPAVLFSSPRLLGVSFYVADDWHDVEIFFWDFWWLGEALRSGQDPWFTTAVFYPAGTSLGFHPTGFLYGLISLPFQMLLGVATGVVLAYNLITLASLALAAWFTFLLARRLGAGDLPALLAGLIYSFSAYHFWHLGRLHVGGIEFLPLFMLALLGLVARDVRPWRAGLATGGAGVLLLYSSLTNFSSAILMTVSLAGILLLRDRRRLLHRRVLVGAAVAAAVILLAALPFLHAWIAYPAPVRGARSVDENTTYSADLLGYVVPGHNSVPYGFLAPFLDSARTVRGEETFTGFLPWLLLPFAFMGDRRTRPWRWLILAAVFGLLSLGPFLKILGHETGLPLPYRLLYEVVPLLKVNRTPVRYAAPFLLFLAVLAGLGARHLEQRFPRAWVMPLLLLVGLGEGLFHVPLTPRQEAPAVYAQVADSDGVVINVPLYHARVERRLMYHQIFHGRPVTNACIPRASDTPHHLIEGTQLRACLLDGAACARADPATVAGEIGRRHVSWVLLHTRFLQPAHADAVDLLLQRAGARQRIDDPAEIRAYRF
ncbi:MAG: hypothetical protein O7C74_00840 [Acidobacteria bacterium]|nr:hypothetical protein [Acidobacteriota bacterium]